MKFGYARTRVSTEDQNPASQLVVLKNEALGGHSSLNKLAKNSFKFGVYTLSISLLNFV
jgi:hypothetical protein